MAVNKYIVLMCTFSCLCCMMCQLNLSEDSSCPATNVTNGTCVSLYRCGSAVLTYLYRNAEFLADNQLPSLPVICSHKNDEPVVCCTDCVLSKREYFADSAIAPYGILVSRRGSLAWRKCLDFFQRLPYPCRGKGNVELTRTWREDKLCHNISLKVTIDAQSHDLQRWKFPHLALLGYGDTVDSAQWLCEGTVISERFILTAAHCTNAGILIRFDNEILPACLDVRIHDVSLAEAAGVPSTYNSTQPEELQMVYLDKLNGIECMNTYKPDNNLMHGYDPRTQTCYVARNRTEDTCKRIAGSPLQVDQFKCQYTIVGVTSFAKECGTPDLADIYTRIVHYLPWIEKIVWPEED